MQFSRDENQHLRNDLTNLRHLYGETQKDNQLLRKSLGKYEERTKTIILNQEGKEKLIVQLEEANNKVMIMILFSCLIGYLDFKEELTWALFDPFVRECHLVFSYEISLFCDVLRDSISFVQFKKHEKHPWRSVTFSKAAGESMQP